MDSSRITNEDRSPLFGASLEELGRIAAAFGQPAFVSAQMADWLYKKVVGSVDDMANLSKTFRGALAERYVLGRKAPEHESVSRDGTKKYLFGTGHGRFVEAAYIPESDRATLCLSTQVGCKMGCLFCMTGKQGFQGNLGPGEIVNQFASLPERDRITNIVYMGMGEPLDNLENVLASLEIFTADWGFALSPRRITVSSVGIIPGLEAFLARSECHLAISLHSPFDDERRSLMPVQNVYPLAEVLALLRSSPIARRRRISFEYIMFGGLNDTPRHSRELVRILNGIRCRVNLIRFHPIPDTPLQASPDSTLLAFEEQLRKAGVMTTIRKSRGQDILAACGLLSTKTQMSAVSAP
ncbi:MAG TPA: 23S rRNA (adenine(2503)-C(2))-methyltransferase RlmN [Rectinemataceae bacterium]|nr:23S rRNA (adenine(2503)-C(2))-methyltransferase RlmN [Rectinemataceae bacterium]